MRTDEEGRAASRRKSQAASHVYEELHSFEMKGEDRIRSQFTIRHWTDAVAMPTEDIAQFDVAGVVETSCRRSDRATLADGCARLNGAD